MKAVLISCISVESSLSDEDEEVVPISDSGVGDVGQVKRLHKRFKKRIKKRQRSSI